MTTVARLLTEATDPEQSPRPNSQDSSLEEWITSWAQENSSAVEIWGSEKVWQRIKGVIDAGGDVKSISVGEDTEKVDLRNWARKHLEANPGYRKLAFEDNISSAELILYKLPGGPARSSMQNNPKTAAVEQLIDKVVGRLNEDDAVGVVSGEVGGNQDDPRDRTTLASTADEIEDAASMVAGLIDRTPEFADSPTGQVLLYRLKRIYRHLTDIASEVEELAARSHEAEERSERLPSMSNTPAAESVRKMVDDVAKSIV